MSGTAPFLSAVWYRAAALRPRLAEQARIRLHHYRGRPWYVVTDTITGRVHRLTPAALGIVAAMDGHRTLDALWQEAAVRLGEDAPSQDEVLHLLAQLHASDLLSADAVPDAQEVLERQARHEARRWRSLLNPLSLRFGLVNPDRLIRATLPFVGKLVSLPGLLLWLALVLPALGLAWEHWPALTRDIGDRILATDNLFLLAVCLPLTKVLHEFGHGFATRRFGGAVPEMGVMFLLLLPMPYVDASAAAGFRSRTQRLVVGAAGMLVETALAALAMFVWACVEPGLVRAVAFNVVFAASVTTVLFNANPLMRYDGYYILSDLIEIPNLGQRATRYWAYLADRYLFGRSDLPSPAASAGERAWFLVYAPLSGAYRLAVLGGIALFLASRYAALGVALAVYSLVTAVLLPAARALLHVATSANLQNHRGRAVAVAGAALALAAILVLAVPAPHHTMAEGVVWLPETAMVRAGADGFVQRLLAQPGQPLAAGTEVAESIDPELTARRDALRGRVAELVAELQAERFSKLVDAMVTETELARANAELARAEARFARLTARARQPGILAVPRAADMPGRFLHEGDLIGYVLPQEGGRIVRAVVGQEDLDLVRTHLRRAELQIIGHPGQVFRTRIVREVPAGRDTLPSMALGSAGGGGVAVDPRDGKGLRTLRRMFQIDILLPAAAAEDAFGARVLVRLEHDWEPLGAQLYRRLRQLLLSRLQA